MSRPARLFLTTLAAALLLCSTADAGKRARARKAKEFFNKGETAYTMGKFEIAVDHYEKAYELTKHPALLFNLAQAHRKAGNGEKALHLYKSYLRQQPNAPNTADVEGLIARLEAKLQAATQPAAAEAAGPEPPPDNETTETATSEAADTAATEPAATETATETVTAAAEPRATAQTKALERSLLTRERKPLLSTGGYASIGILVVGIAAVVVGAVFLSSAASASSEINAVVASGGPWTAELQDTYNSGQSAEGVGIAALATGGGLTILATTLFFIALPDDPPKLALIPADGGAFALLQVGF